VGRGPRVRIRSEYGTPEFDIEYRAALARACPEGRAVVQFPPMAACPLPRDYRLGRAFRRHTSPARQHLCAVLETAGHEPYARITTATILAGKERRAEIPAQARNFLDAMRALFRWALKARFVKVDPTIGVDNPKRKSGDGFRAWTEEDVAAYERTGRLVHGRGCGSTYCSTPA
jgi:hypothetical protein